MARCIDGAIMITSVIGIWHMTCGFLSPWSSCLHRGTSVGSGMIMRDPSLWS